MFLIFILSDKFEQLSFSKIVLYCYAAILFEDLNKTSFIYSVEVPAFP